MFLTAAGVGGGGGGVTAAGAGVTAAAGAGAAALAGGGGGSVAQPTRQAAVSNNVGSEFCIVIMHLLKWMKRLND
jgi:hypothetical protein